jgi:arsenical pump membrane protein
VLAIGVAATAVRRRPPQLNARALALLFALAVALGATARIWREPAQLLNEHGAWAAAGAGALASLLLNNLPAALLLSAKPPAHLAPLLLGLDVGPNLAVTGSLSAVLWLQAARAVGARASITTYSRLGLLLVPPTLTAALMALLAARI